MKYYQCEVCCEVLDDLHLLFKSEREVQEHIKKEHNFEQLLKYAMGFTLQRDMNEEQIKEDGYKIVD